ncbi:conserved hypothetical protein [Curtobacterium sp. 8I-2]|nr:conserved hypothetical protein [Curtobacterium sp. 8I-2]
MLRPPRARLSVRPGGAAAVAPTRHVGTGVPTTAGRLSVTIGARVLTAHQGDGVCEASDSGR